jgi:hypothetical protein
MTFVQKKSIQFFSKEKGKRSISTSDVATMPLSSAKKWLFFSLFLVLILLERIFTLHHFSSIYTDADQIIMWNGAMDYSHGVFHEPFFYGQAYNYMLESLIAVPLLWLGIPVQIAVSISTSLIAIFPFVILANFLAKRQQYFWAFLCLAFPIILPLNYTFLTAIPRGFIQAHLFVPLLFIPLLEPKNEKNIIFLFIGSALSFIANQSSVLLIFPIVIYVYSFHVRSISFYIKVLVAIPIVAFDYYSKLFYVHHPERVVHEIVGMKLDSATFMSSIKNVHLFEDLSPFLTGWGIIYPLAFIALAVFAFLRKKNREFLFISSLLILLLITLAIPKTQEPYPLPNAGIFFSTSRLYLFLPLLFILVCFLVFQKVKINIRSIYALLLISISMSIYKFMHFQETIDKTVSQTSFPVTKNEELLNRAKEYERLTNKYNLDLIIHNTPEGWSYFYDAYTYHPILNHNNEKVNKTISICGSGDRRTWLYKNSLDSKTILLNGFKLDVALLKDLDYEMIDDYKFIIKNNTLKVNDLMVKLSINYGNTPL